MNHLQRIAVVGSSCAGKTTLAGRLASRLGAPHTELDALYWGPAWTPLEKAEFRARVTEIAAGPLWIIDGNYSSVRDLIWSRATAVVWLDYPFPLVFRRAVARTLRRVVTREEVCGGNRERLRDIVDPDWIPWWVMRTFRRRRSELCEWLGRPEYGHLRPYLHYGPRESDAWLEGLVEKGPGRGGEKVAERQRRT